MMKHVEPTVYLIAKPELDRSEVRWFLESVGGLALAERWDSQHSADLLNAPEHDVSDLTELMGRLCYRSYAPGLNPNVTKVRDNQDAYLANILEQRHGSVIEHASFSFIFQDVSRVLTHELVRHRPGVAISQESLRYVRLTELPFWLPDWALADEELKNRVLSMLSELEDFQGWMSSHFKLDDPGVPFHEKKLKTSFMRRFAPEGLATTVGWTANIRTLRHVITERTAPGAEEEIRLLFGKVGHAARGACPSLFCDFTVTSDGAWVPEYRKV
jgi:thymidylate synthase (FAD)